jgi:homocysteine S-methyltransferase
MKQSASPLEPFLRQNGFVLLDGGLATELEQRGHDLDHPLWSARVLRSSPDAIAEVHRAYLDAGADCITTASYQVSLLGRHGLTVAESERLLRLSVQVAVEARDTFSRSSPDRLRPLVAASIGPDGATLGVGSE